MKRENHQAESGFIDRRSQSRCRAGTGVAGSLLVVTRGGSKIRAGKGLNIVDVTLFWI